MVESLGRYDCAFYENLLAQHGLFIAKRVTHVNFMVPYMERAYIGIHAYYIVILYRLTLTFRVVKNHSLSSTPVQNISSIKRSVLQYTMFQFGMVR